jgi:hypothetical protein
MTQGQEITPHNPETGELAETATVTQGFGTSAIERRNEIGTSALVAQARAQIEAQYVMAMQRPRSWDTVRTKLMAACARPGFADAALYRKPQRQKNPKTGRWEDGAIEGLSVRFAEECLRVAGNMKASAFPVYDDDHRRTILVMAIDLESNAINDKPVTISKVTERSEVKDGRRVLSQRENSAGKTVYLLQATDDETAQKESALVQKAKRNLILSLVPGDIREDCERKCRATRAARDKADPDAARKAVFDAFAELRIYPSDLSGYMGHDVAQASPAEIDQLRGIYVAIREGEATWAELLAEKEKPEAEQTKTSRAGALADEIRAKNEAKARADAEAKAAKAP